MFHIFVLVWRWSFFPWNRLVTIRSWPWKALLFDNCSDLTRLTRRVCLGEYLSAWWIWSIIRNQVVTSPRKWSLWLCEILRCSWANFITFVEWIICRNSELWISVLWFAIISVLFGFWNWRLFMCSSSLITLFVDICLCYWASRYFCRLNLDLRMIALIILSKHTTCFCAELICST